MKRNIKAFLLIFCMCVLMLLLASCGGHTHIPMSEMKGNGILCLNPGSVSLPKGGYPKSYMIFENRHFTVKSFDGEAVLQTEI